MSRADLILLHWRRSTRQYRLLLLPILLGAMLALLGALWIDGIGRAIDRTVSQVDAIAVADKHQKAITGLLQRGDPQAGLRFGQLAQWRAVPGVARAVPVLTHDSYRGFRIVGTEQALVDVYGAQMQDGIFWGRPFDVVLGNAVARKTGLNPGDRFTVRHGVDGDGPSHQQPYEVTGILARSNGIADYLVFTSLQSEWLQHGAIENAPDAPLDLILLTTQPRGAGITAPPGLVNVSVRDQRSIANDALLGLPRLLRLGGAVLLLLGCIVFARFEYQRAKTRSNEFAMMQLIGAPPARVRSLTLWPLAAHGFAAIAAGAALAHLLHLLISFVHPDFVRMAAVGIAFAPGEIWLLLLGLLLSCLAALPAALVAAQASPDILFQPGGIM